MLKVPPFVLAVVLVALVVALYGQFLWNPIAFDDLHFFVLDASGNQVIGNYRYSPFELRSLPYATLAWSTAAFGQDMYHFRVENLLLHAAVVLALFFFLKMLFEAVFAADSPGLSPRVAAFAAALLFALHPVATYAVGYLVQRTILMATFFCLLAMLAYLHGTLRNSPRWLWASVLFYYLAVFSKEHAIMLPAVLLALTLMSRADWREWLRRNWPVFAAFLAIAVTVLLARKGVLGSSYEPFAQEFLAGIDSRQAYPLSVLTQSWLFFKYAALWLLPNPEWMSIDMREPFARSLLSPYLLALCAFAAWGAGALWLLLKRGRRGLLGFALLFPWLMFMTEFSAVRIQEPFVLYRSYLWAPGFACLLPLLFTGARARVSFTVLSLIFVAMFVISMERMRTMAHSLLLWDDAVKLVKGRTDLPGAERIFNNRGAVLLQERRFDQALADFWHVLELNPDVPAAYTNIGVIYLEKGQLREAVEAFSRAIAIMDKSGGAYNDSPYYGRAMAYERLGMMREAKGDYSVSCKLARKGCDKLQGD